MNFAFKLFMMKLDTLLYRKQHPPSPFQSCAPVKMLHLKVRGWFTQKRQRIRKGKIFERSK